ncbi:MAG: hypothetical protein ACRDRA_10130 [Pseudonocardiaceae bacterium]
MDHPYVLRTPWYVLSRGPISVLDPEARRPAIQKYAVPDFVERLLIPDPRESLKFDDDDLWSYPVPVGFPGPGPGRLRFATHQLIRTPIRKLYQPNHDRFYALTIELFCDEPGLPRPSQVDGLEVKFVIRRERLLIESTDPKDLKTRRDKARSLAREVAVELHTEQYQRAKDAPDVPDSDDVANVTWAQHAAGHVFTAGQATLLAEIAPRLAVEAWTLGADGRGNWAEVPVKPGAPPELAPGEQELPMWRLPPRDGDCPAGQTRSLWFGLVPTFSGDVDAAGLPKFDDESIYRMWCFVRKPPPPGREHCPPKYSWSDGTEPYRLASFFDPAGTKNRRVSITMPDFRALAARAGEPQGPGGVEIVQPPGSQLTFDGNNGNPQNGSVGGDITQRCTYALELLMIVAMFLFSLFLPIVVFLFQLWWMLLLRFCWPPNQAALQILNAHLTAGGTIAEMDPAEQAALDEVVEVTGAAATLATVPKLSEENETAIALVASSQPDPIPPPTDPTPETKPADPLCLPGLL